MDVEAPHFGPCLLSESLEDDRSCFVVDLDISVSECYCASRITEFTHAE